MKPRIDRTNLKTTTIRVGRQVFLDVDVKGEPVPEVRWFDEKGKEVKTHQHFTVDNIPHNTKFTLADGQRKHTGRYKVVATNEHGEDSATVEIVVLGPPSRPMGKFCCLHQYEETDADEYMGLCKNRIYTLLSQHTCPYVLYWTWGWCDYRISMFSITPTRSFT